jgi:EAL domain-containing protein (putative c-di-GMP-specific phosphodiesterase class I)
VISRLQDGQGEALPAGRFLPWLERFGWMPRLDVLVLEKVLAHLRGHDQVLALNLSAATLADPRPFSASSSCWARTRRSARGWFLKLARSSCLSRPHWSNSPGACTGLVSAWRSASAGASA